jgi:hypothetical protein
METQCPPSELESVLRKELSTLSHRQTEALKKTPYIRMTAEKAFNYEDRCKRINEICELLLAFHPKS